MVDAYGFLQQMSGTLLADAKHGGHIVIADIPEPGKGRASQEGVPEEGAADDLDSLGILPVQLGKEGEGTFIASGPLLCKGVVLHNPFIISATRISRFSGRYLSPILS